MTDDDVTVEEVLAWSDEKITKEEAKVASVEVLKYKPQKLNFIIQGKEHTPTKEQEERINSIMKPLDNIHFSWTIEQMQNIVKSGIESRTELLAKMKAKISNHGNATRIEQNSEDIDVIKEELSDTIKHALNLAKELSRDSNRYDRATKQKKLGEVKDIVANLQSKLGTALDTDIELLRDMFESEFTAKHEDEEALDSQIPKLLTAKQNYIVNNKKTDVLESIANLEDFFKSK